MNRNTLTWTSLPLLAALCILVPKRRAGAEPNVLRQVIDLGLPHLAPPVAAYYSEDAKPRAESFQNDIRQMQAFFRESLGIQPEVNLAVLNPTDWKTVSQAPYGLPGVGGTPPVIFMPAQSGGFAFGLMMGRKEAIPTKVFHGYLESSQRTFEAAADDFVDIIGFHELGHVLCDAYGIDPACHWLNEFVASYFAYAFISERKPESKRVFDLLGRPSKTRPNNTTLADFERLYVEVDDYGWYQGMFESRIQELYPKMGVQFLRELKRQFPAETPPEHAPLGRAVKKPMTTEEVLEKLESIAPGFRVWARGFGS